MSCLVCVSQPCPLPWRANFRGELPVQSALQFRALDVAERLGAAMASSPRETAEQGGAAVLAAVLAVIGYSLNDTIVVADRIRENFRKLRRRSPVEVIDISLTETLGRTLVTSLTTLLVLLALAIFGGEMIHGFALALLAGVAIGTYSSIYVSATILLAMGVSKEDVAIPVKEGGSEDGSQV